MKPCESSLSIQEKIIRMHNKGLSIWQMCKELGRDKCTVDYHRNVLGLVKKRKFKKRPPTVEDKLVKTTNQWLTRRWV